MKNTILIVLCFFAILSCVNLKAITENSVFSVNAIQADKRYYNKAVLEYNLVNQVIKKFRLNEYDDSIMNISARDSKKIENRIYDCKYKIPRNLEDLTSGFQYRYYLFNSDNIAALQAFGIADIKSQRKAQYLVIDYIQYSDFKCSNLPTIRYAVGLRSELKFIKTKDSIGINGKGSLAKLAAQVELGRAEVNFSLKTIGLTGVLARQNIPQGVSFDVSTYKDFQNSIEFLKTRLENEQKDSSLIVKPEIIPVLDEYRPNTKTSLDIFANDIIEISLAKDKLKKISENKLSIESRKRIDSLYDLEIDRAFESRKNLDKLHAYVYSSKTYIDALITASPNFYDLKKKDSANSKPNLILGKNEGLFNSFLGYPSLNKLNSNKLDELERIYYNSNISLYEFNKFLNIINRNEISDSQLNRILEVLKKNPTIDGLIKAADEVEEE
ncbi:hypothetical protein U8527_12465 [Kordia algicida OT-1]|uniref:Uncharacterized protein n=1 Tax=Kordia algicida OT-1 TaxID=391587 RepID=A9EBH0_9FLAO|nr:hypothetical protein [Kordia algicida]EDP94470.1 hypothetical protein KAOT1_06022 [Kordia algicida OT-1]